MRKKHKILFVLAVLAADLLLALGVFYLLAGSVSTALPA